MTLKIEVGSILRLCHAVWKVTGIHYGATQCEDLVSIRRLDHNPGSAFGKTQPDSILPLAILLSHPFIENV